MYINCISVTQLTVLVLVSGCTVCENEPAYSVFVTSHPALNKVVTVSPGTTARSYHMSLLTLTLLTLTFHVPCIS